MGWAIAFLAVSMLLGVAFSNLKNTRPHVVPGHLQKISQVPDFSLTDQTGRTITLADLKGKIWVANFIFTRCKGPCPLSTLRMAELNKRLAKARKELAPLAQASAEAKADAGEGAELQEITTGVLCGEAHGGAFQDSRGASRLQCLASGLFPNGLSYETLGPFNPEDRQVTHDMPHKAGQ